MGRGNVSKINRKEERKQQAASRKAKQKAIISKMENLVGTKSISELQDMSWGEKVRFVMMSSWILNLWYEKLGMLLFIFLGMWKILNLFGLF